MPSPPRRVRRADCLLLVHERGSRSVPVPPYLPSGVAATNSEIDGKITAHFRGRRLHGRKVQLPEGYSGAIVERHERQSSQEEAAERKAATREVVDVDGEDEQIERGAVETKAEFEAIVVWGHEATADAGADPYVRGVEEWISLAGEVRIALLSFFRCLFFAMTLRPILTVLDTFLFGGSKSLMGGAAPGL